MNIIRIDNLIINVAHIHYAHYYPTLKNDDIEETSTLVIDMGSPEGYVINLHGASADLMYEYLDALSYHPVHG